MTEQEFDQRIMELRAMVAKPVEDLFAAEYARLLNDICADDAGPRPERAARMKDVLTEQVSWLVGEYMTEYCRVATAPRPV